MPYFLGVDAGGTKTDFLLGDETRELARVRVGSIKRMRVSAQEAERNLCEALAALTEVSGVSMETLAHCRVGAAGNTVALVTDWMREAFARHVGGGLSIVNDVEIALDAAFQGGRGVLVLAGTGSNIAARSVTGEIVTAGGWGPALADHGSGHTVGLLGLRHCFLAIDRQQPTIMLQKILDFWALKSVDELVAYANQQPAPDFSRLAPIIFDSAGHGDPAALAVIRLCSEDLAEQISLVIERLSCLEGKSGFVLTAIAYTGSVITQGTSLRTAVQEALRQRWSGVEWLQTAADPPVGALWGARRAALVSATNH